jgi:hypothetical protein
MSRSIEFEKLANSKGVLVDLGSVSSFFEGRGIEYLLNRSKNSYRPSGPESHFDGVNVVEALLRDASIYYREPLRLLELVVVHETIILDAVSLENEFGQEILEDDRAQNLISSPPFSLCRIPDEVRESVADEMQRHGESLRYLECDFSSGDKAVHDYLYENGKADFADSTDSAFRAFYYVFLARSSGLPLVISEEKQRILDQLRSEIIAQGSAAHRRLSEKALGELKADTVWSAPLPPVQEMILRTCWEKKVSPWEAGMELRASKEAIAYRRLINELDRLSRGSLGDRALATAKLSEIETHLNSWSERPGSTPGRPWRKLNLQKIPGIGWIAEAFGLFANIPIPDIKVGKSDAALVFMSEWFRPSAR